MGSALETLCGQAFGAGDLNMLGIYLQRSWIILLTTAFFLSFFYIFSTPILKILGTSDSIAEMAGRFSIYMIPELYAYAINFPIQKFLQAQSKVMVMTWISAGALVLHLFLSWLCIVKLGLGIVGAAITLDVSWAFLAVGQLYCITSWVGVARILGPGSRGWPSQILQSSSGSPCLQLSCYGEMDNSEKKETER
ncbi:Protein TRANSPARENT TESTA 12 [Acorus calamus]|uniref:Protein TRANSPARENT TESTA 12 n=1 Tax=Acorus calamus TaxID=4465 RepID=A0AAV9E3I8_ACOCL|nr:Protein TRANSPARENT TESTA 12 [Acorus calamus]